MPGTRTPPRCSGRYAERLWPCCALSARLARHVDPEDVVQSAYRSFAAREGRFTLSRGGDLWRLLVAITVHKVRRLAEHFAAAKRSAARESDAGAGAPGT
ncbi:MAG: hypothetical protein U0797_23215 [Gemmataceae bacterium]